MSLIKPELLNVTRRRRILEEVKSYCAKLGNSRYDVVRGAVVLATWSWAGNKKYLIAILADESTFMSMTNRFALTLEFWTELRTDQTDVMNDPELDQMYIDAADVFMHLANDGIRDPDDPSLPLVMRIETGTESALEVSDATLKVQGLIATAFVIF